MTALVPLLDVESDALVFTAVEIRAGDETFGLMVAAEAPNGRVGLALELSALNGRYMVHPAALVSIGVPTDALVTALVEAWNLHDPAVRRGGENRAVSGLAVAKWRECGDGRTVWLTPANLKWERARFGLQLATCKVDLDLDLDQKRVSPRVPLADRRVFLAALCGVETRRRHSKR